MGTLMEPSLLHANVYRGTADFDIADRDLAAPHRIDTQAHLKPVGMEKWRGARGFAAVNREVAKRDPQPPGIKVKGSQLRLCRRSAFESVRQWRAECNRSAAPLERISTAVRGSAKATRTAHKIQRVHFRPVPVCVMACRRACCRTMRPSARVRSSGAVSFRQTTPQCDR